MVVIDKVTDIDELAYWLVLNRLPLMGPRRFKALLQHEKCLANCFVGEVPHPDFIQWCQHNGIKEIKLDWEGVQKDLKWCEKPHHEILTWQDPHYPTRLKEVFSAPPLLFVAGQINVLNHPQIAVVGSRHPSKEGRENAYQFSYSLSKAGWTITSGLALGVDGASHEGALAANGTTIAVLGSSIDTIYPTKHEALAENITQRGALVSEFFTHTPPRAHHFPRRNRLISGLSQGVLVIESALKSGSLITANHALEQGVDVFALPGSIHNPLAKGCHHLIRQGAKCVDNISHILEELPPATASFTSENTTMHRHHLQSTLNNPICIKLEKESAQPHLMQLLTHIDRVCTPIDLMVSRTGLTHQAISAMLLELELTQQINQVPGGYIRR